MSDLISAWVSAGDWADLSVSTKPLVFILAGLLCFMLGASTRLAPRTPTRLRQLWLLLCPLYLLVAANALVQGDVLWLQWARSFARAFQIYEERRLFQLLALVLLVVLGSKLWQLWQSSQQLPHLPHPKAARVSVLHRMLLIGAVSTLALLLLRFVSFHYIDLVLNTFWLRHSVASWLEATSLGLVGLASALEILRSYGHF
jgi:hypothetical protein